MLCLIFVECFELLPLTLLGTSLVQALLASFYLLLHFHTGGLVSLACWLRCLDLRVDFVELGEVPSSFKSLGQGQKEYRLFTAPLLLQLGTGYRVGSD